jgi:hypothetical protein
MVMSRTFEVRQEFGATAEQVRAMMVDADYIRRRAERTGAISVDIEVVAQSGDPAAPIGLRITRVLPTEGAPSFARSLLGDTITVVESQEWPPVVAGTASARMEASFGSLLRLTGTIDLADAASGSVAITQAVCKASVPLVGGKVESLVEQQVRDYLAFEVQVAQEWLVGRDRGA